MMGRFFSLALFAEIKIMVSLTTHSHVYLRQVGVPTTFVKGYIFLSTYFPLVGHPLKTLAPIAISVRCRGLVCDQPTNIKRYAKKSLH